MAVIGITGGIATGKTTFVRALLRQLPGDVFNADECARELLDTDPRVRQQVKQIFGERIYESEGGLDRVELRRLIFDTPLLRRRLEEVVHPAVRATWLAMADRHREIGAWFYADIPLLFETGAEAFVDSVVVVACSPATQQRRLLENRQLTRQLAENIIGAQFPLATKIQKADHLIWNDASVSCLDGQAGLLSGWLRQRYG